MKTNRKNKILAMVLTLVMVLTLIPAFSVTVSAAASFTLDKQIYKPAHVMTFNFAGVTEQMSKDQATVVINNEKGEWTGSYFRTTGKTGSFSMTMNAPGAEGKYEAVYYASLNGNAQNLVQKITFTVSYAPTAEEAANVKVTMDKSVYRPGHVMTFNFVGVTPEMSADQATVTIMNEKGEWTGSYFRTTDKTGSFSMTMNAPSSVGNYEARYYVSLTSDTTTKGANLVYTVPFSVSYAPTLQEWQTVRVSLNKTAYKPGETMTFNFTNVTQEMSDDQATVAILNEKGVWTGFYIRTSGKTGSFSMTMNAPGAEGNYEARYSVSLTSDTITKGANHLMSVYFVVNKDGVGSPTKTTSMAPQPKDNASGAGTGVTVTQPENTGGTGTTTTTTTAKGHVYDASTLTGGEVIIFDNWNTGGVSSNPTAATTFTTSQSYTLTFIDTYHYNNNGTLAGTISLKDQNGTTYGPWQTIGTGGQGGVANASWEYHFPTSVTIPAGTYTIIDSNPSTWSRNSSSGGSGFAQVRGIPAGGTSTPAAGGDTKTFNGHSYKVYEQSMTWTDAKAYAESLGGHLVTITSAAEQTFIESIRSSSDSAKINYWIGASQANSSSKWQWVTGETWDYTNWGSGQPDRYGTSSSEISCAMFMNKDSARQVVTKWGDTNNTHTHTNFPDVYNQQNVGFIVEWDSGTNATPATTGDTTVTFGTGTYTGGNPVGIDEGISVGPSFSWTTQSGVLGYRIYRSRNSGVQGLSVTDFYIENTEFIDVNVDSNTTYYYTIRAVLAEADPWNDVEEKLGSPSSEIKITTEGEILGGDASKVGQKHFISMVVDKPNMTVDEKVQEIDPGRGTVPLNLDGRVRVPISKIIEAMGGKASYEDSTRTVTLTRGDINVEMVIGKKGMKVNGVNAEMDVAPELVNGRTMIAIRFAATSTGAKIDFINSKKQVVVVYVG
ncbi:hypothetical protein FACS1894105_10740 [Clostridia bacterium]|nr:hypothetical protein FACS1894105_10740 [Clostridia bacterium]